MKKTPAENAWAMLHYQDYDAVPVLDFSYWEQLVRQEWRNQGHLTQEECDKVVDGKYATGKYLNMIKEIKPYK